MSRAKGRDSKGEQQRDEAVNLVDVGLAGDGKVEAKGPARH